MRILYITFEDLSLQKGSVVHVKEVIDGLRKRGHQIGLIARASRKSGEPYPFYNIHYSVLLPFNFLRSKRKLYLISGLWLFIHLFKVLPRYDVIYVREFPVSIIAFLPRLIFRKKLVFEMNGLASEEQKLRGDSIYNRMLAFLIRKGEKIGTKCSDRVISVTPYIARHLIKDFGYQADRVEVVSNGVNTEKFYPIEDQGLLVQLRNRLGIGEREALIVFVGNLAPWQGIEYLIGVAPYLLKKTKNVRFLIVGEGIWKDKLLITVKKLNLSEHFIFAGGVDYDKIPLYINIADICILPKRHMKSGYSPIKLYEYMACGKPVISSKAEGLEMIEQEGMGRVVDIENSDSFVEALVELIEDSKKREAMGKKALLVARQKFDWKIKTKEIEEILKRLLA